MTLFKGKSYWLIGASEGVGEALAHALSAQGARVIVSARNTERLEDVCAALPGPSRAIRIDVTDTDDIARAVREAGDVDGVVFLAGVYWPMSAQTWDPAQATAMADVNFTGAMRVMGAVVPQMVARGNGHIVLTGSLSGFRGLPGAIGYCASKAGVMSLAESMYADLRKTGVRVQLANPGFVRTRLTDKNDFKMPFIMSAEDAAEEMMGLMRSRRFKKSFPRAFSLVFRGSQFLPDWLYYRLFA